MSPRRLLAPAAAARLNAVALAAFVLVALMLAASSAPPARAVSSPVATTTATPRTTLPIIERQVMCVTCKIPLNLAQSPQADRERAFIQSLIDRGESEAQIKRALVDQYGAAALALPGGHGFSLAAYLVPLAAVLALLAGLAVLLPRWRRHVPAQLDGEARAPTLSPTDAARLDADLTRFD